MPPDETDNPGLDIPLLLNNNQVAFTQSARRHRVGRARVLSVLELHGYVEIEQAGRIRLLWVGADWSGRLLEVIAVVEDSQLVVIHAMDAQRKLIDLYAARGRHGTP